MVENFEKTPTEILRLSNKRVNVEIDPQGAFLNSVIIDRKEVIYKRKDDNPGRGGVPILGPTPGPVKGSLWENLYPNMPNHGIDRKVLWSVSEARKNEVVLKRTMGPKEFLFVGEIAIKFKLLKDGVSISKVITNFEEKSREIGNGFHPYFTTMKNSRFSPDIINKLHPLTPGKAEIIKPGISEVTINTDNDSYLISASPEPVQTVVWSDKPDLYECIEPWWSEEGKGDVLEPNETKTYTLKIRKIAPVK